MSSQLTTHALDTVRGQGAAGLKVDIRRIAPEPAELGSAVLGENGRAILLPSGELHPGVYELVFHAADYHRQYGVALPDPPFFDSIAIRFGVAAGTGNYHVPLLLSPYSYATYRGN
jgi:5-hydroxyisourate hydrolase